MKKLVVYFSATGTTKRAAERLATAVSADLFEIRPAIPYTDADLDWTSSKSRSSAEMNDAHSRPEIAGAIPDIADYDTVFIGFPIWWYTAPHIIRTFLESCDFSGKTLAPFATSGGSGIGKAADELKKLCPNANWKSGKLLTGASDKVIAAWASEI